ncbi:hypothetical protein ACFSTD_00515 [Novosphingobium colocasiae]|uniref:Enoyl-CoA hydratase n=1 Tax=Novosphingobium colocasiae TaxID=1256513 RepID=A0A918UKP7_9SPHN|nr:hypothetical protein [Novosphingobium colocasiae]GGZ17348.1 hypothetical protein GCM10011614_34850 [Novosphingobium colocasiae]
MNEEQSQARRSVRRDGPLLKVTLDRPECFNALNQAIDASGLEAVIAMEDRNQVLCSQSEDFAEGIAAFLEKRRPSYAQ